MKNNRTIIFWVLSLTIISIIIGISIFKNKDSVLDGKEDVVVQLQWFDSAQFAGLYVAKDKGFFLEEDLNVTLRPIAGYTSDPIAILTDGQADIAIATADQVLINRDNGKEIRAFGTVFNRSLAVYTYKNNSIQDDSLNILKNRKIAVYKKFDTENILLALIDKYDLDIKSDNIIQAPQLAQQALITGQIDILGSYLINEPILLEMAGHSVDYLDPVDYGIEFYSDTYLTTSDVFSRSENEKGIDKNTIVKFLRAANRGWTYTKNNPEEAIDIMFNQITNITKSENFESELSKLSSAIDFIGDGPNNRPGFMLRDKWLNMEQHLFEIGRINQTGYIEELCHFEIIDETYAN